MVCESEHGETTMDINIAKMVAEYLANILVQNRVVPPPQSDEDVLNLLTACLSGFVDYLHKAQDVQVIEVNAQGSSAVN
jgi:hypothetical protein